MPPAAGVSPRAPQMAAYGFKVKILKNYYKKTKPKKYGFRILALRGSPPSWRPPSFSRTQQSGFRRGWGSGKGNALIAYLSPRRPGGDSRVEAEKRGFQLLALRGRRHPDGYPISISTQSGFRRGGGPEEGNLKGLSSLGFPSSGRPRLQGDVRTKKAPVCGRGFCILR